MQTEPAQYARRVYRRSTKRTARLPACRVCSLRSDACELISNLSNSDGLGRGRKQVKQNLESLTGHSGDCGIEYGPPQHEKSAHWIGYFDLAYETAQPSGECTDSRAVAVPVADPAARYVRIGYRPRESQRFSRSKSSISGRIRSSCCRSASITATYGAEEARMPSMQAVLRPRRPIRLMQRTRPMGSRDIANIGGRSVRRIVVNKNDLPVDPTKHDIEAIYQERNVVLFR